MPLVDIEIPRDSTMLVVRRDDGSMTVSVPAEAFAKTYNHLASSFTAAIERHLSDGRIGEWIETDTWQ